MDVDKITLFAAVKKRLAWLTQRQEVLAQNIANSDTPDYRARDLKPFQFQELIRRENAQLNMDVSTKGHLDGRRKRLRDFSEEAARVPYETAPAGNSVVIEEQMQKVNESSVSHRLTSDLYKKHMAMFKMVLGRSSG